MEVDVIITTWGHPSWSGLAQRVAQPGAAMQAPTHLFHTETEIGGLARNAAVEAVNPRGWICFLDADDQLEPGYIDAMSTPLNDDWNYLLTPALRLPGLSPGFFSERNIIDGLNPCPIGTLIHRSVFDAVGQFWGERAWEDWSLFRRAVLFGCTIRFVEGAVYDASNSTRNGRNTVKNPNALRREIVNSHNVWMGAM